MERLLKPLVQIKSVSTQARPPSELVVQVQERVPVALVKRGAEYLLVDVEGVRLTATANPANVKLPVIDGGAGAIGKDLFRPPPPCWAPCRPPFLPSFPTLRPSPWTRLN